MPPQQLDLSRCSIMGHSMGGHGAITLGLRNPERFRSISALAPISHASSPDCPMAQKALISEYLAGEGCGMWGVSVA